MTPILKSCRKKAGFVLAIMTGVVIAMCVRSLFIRDEIRCRIGSRSHLFLSSNRTRLGFTKTTEAGPDYRYAFYSATKAGDMQGMWKNSGVRWHWGFGGFDIGKSSYPEARPPLRWYPVGGSENLTCHIPYWSIIVPLAAVTLFFLVSPGPPANEETIRSGE